MKNSCCCLGLFFFTTVCHAGTVKWDVVDIFNPSGTFWQEYCDNLLDLNVGDITCQMVGYKILYQDRFEIILSGQNEITYASYAHGWRELEYRYGELVDSQSMIGDFDDYFFIFGNGHYDDDLKNLTIRRGQSVYLGFFIEVNIYDYDMHTSINTPLFGWVELYYNGSYIEVKRSVIETTGQGIYVGTGFITPEPSTALLALSGCALLLLRRRIFWSCP